MQPSQKPESNGMAEAFVKTFKRDYVYVHDRPDAETVMSQLATGSRITMSIIRTRG